MAKDYQEVNINNKIYKICSFTGQVFESSRQRETIVSSSGGGSGTVRKSFLGNSATVEIDPVHISSTTIVHDEFFLVDENNEEMHIHLKNWGVPVRDGHEAQLIWVYPPKDDSGCYTTMKNLNLNQVEWHTGNVYEMSKKHYHYLKWGGLALSIILGIIFKSFWLFVIIAVGSYWFYNKKAGEVRAELEQYIKQMLN